MAPKEKEAPSIDWDDMTKPAANVNITLAQIELDTAHEVTFHSVKQLPEGALVADVSSPTLDGNTLWLRGSYGPQNGLLSLAKAAEGGENIEGGTFKITRIASEKSPAGYAYHWEA